MGSPSASQALVTIAMATPHPLLAEAKGMATLGEVGQVTLIVAMDQDDSNAQSRKDSVISLRKDEHCEGRIEPAYQHDDECLHDQSIRIGFGALPWPLRRLGWHGYPVHEHNKADEQSGLS
jgi:hypothetical protein